MTKYWPAGCCENCGNRILECPDDTGLMKDCFKWCPTVDCLNNKEEPVYDQGLDLSWKKDLDDYDWRWNIRYDTERDSFIGKRCGISIESKDGQVWKRIKD